MNGLGCCSYCSITKCEIPLILARKSIRVPQNSLWNRSLHILCNVTIAWYVFGGGLPLFESLRSFFNSWYTYTLYNMKIATPVVWLNLSYLLSLFLQRFVNTFDACSYLGPVLNSFDISDKYYRGGLIDLHPNKLQLLWFKWCLQ